MSLFKIGTGAFYLALIGLGLAGCTTTRPGYFDATSSTIAVELSPPIAEVVAGDMVDQLAKEIGPGTGPIVIGGKDTVMSKALEAELRGHGFAIDPSSPSKTAIPLGYAVTGQNGQIFVRLTSPTLEMARVYGLTDDGATSLTPLSILRRTNAPQETP